MFKYGIQINKIKLPINSLNHKTAKVARKSNISFSFEVSVMNWVCIDKLECIATEHTSQKSTALSLSKSIRIINNVKGFCNENYFAVNTTLLYILTKYKSIYTFISI